MVTLSILISTVIIGIIPLVVCKSEFSFLEKLTLFFLVFTIGNELFNVCSLNLDLFKGKNTEGDWLGIIYFMLFIPAAIVWMLQSIYQRRSKAGKVVAILFFMGLLTTSDQVVLSLELLNTGKWSFHYSLIHSLGIAAFSLLFAFVFRFLIRKEKKVG